MAAIEHRYAPTRGRLFAVAAVLCLLACALAASSASAEELVLGPTFGPDGTSATDFEIAAEIGTDQGSGAVYAIDQGKKKYSLYKFGPKGEPIPFTGTAPYISDNQITGLEFNWLSEENGLSVGVPFGTLQVAVNPQSHAFYVNGDHGEALRAFQANGEPANFTAGPGAGTSKITGFEHLSGITVDSSGDIYASDYGPEDGSGGAIHVYAPSGEPIAQFALARAANLAVAPDGSLFAIRAFYRAPEVTGIRELVKLHPSAFPVTPATTYSVEAELPPPFESELHGVPKTPGLAVDPASEDVLVVDAISKGAFNESSRVVEYDPAGNLLRSFAGPGEEGELPAAGGVAGALGIAVSGASGRIYVSYFADNSGSKVETFEPPPPAPPTIVSAGARNVTSSSAEPVAAISPNSLETTYSIEYGTEACSAEPDPCTAIPPVSGSLGAGHKPLGVSRQLSGLAPSTTYHFRVFAENELGSDEAERTFTTQSPGGPFGLFDGRGWEIVSPAQKPGGGAIIPPGTGISAASASGDAFTFQSAGTLEADPQGSRAPEPAQSLARHGASGWGSAEIGPPREYASPVQPASSEFRLFSGDLSRAAAEPAGAAPLSEEASEPAPYLRENFAAPASWRPLVTGKEGFANVPPGTVFGGEPLTVAQPPVSVAGASPGLDHVVLSSSVPLVEGIPQELAGKTLLYEWSEGKLELLSRLPSGQASQGVLGSGESSKGTTTTAISTDGNYVYWNPNSRNALYLRDLLHDESVRLDLVKGGSGEGKAEPIFTGASADGKRAFFTDTQQLTKDAGPGVNLYECDLIRPNIDKCALRDITPETGGEAADVQGLASAVSEDGNTVYFAANGVLSEAPNSEGDTASPGNCVEQPGNAKATNSCNLYVSKLQGETWQTRFIARLGVGDAADWGLAPTSLQTEAESRNLVSATSPNGRYLSFMSSRSPTGYDNADAVSGAADQEVYLYDSATGELRCVSCNPSGGEPQGLFLAAGGPPRSADWRHLFTGRWAAATLPEPNIVGVGIPASYRPRTVLDNGRVLFNAADGLVPADSNGTWDAYEYEPQGVGDCSATSQSPTVASTEGGCVALLSSGTSERETAVLDSSESGDDVFFLTAAQLSVTDTDSAYDVYDARVGGIPATLTPSSECLGEACQPQPSAPNDPTPASAGFVGAGNVPPRHAKKQKKHPRHKARKHNRNRGGSK